MGLRVYAVARTQYIIVGNQEKTQPSERDEVSLSKGWAFGLGGLPLLFDHPATREEKVMGMGACGLIQAQSAS